MIVRLYILGLVAALASGCMQDYPEDLTDTNRGKACTQIGYVSNINVQFNSATALPAHISGSVNGNVAFDSCTSITNDDYVLANDARSVNLLLWLRPGEDIHTRYFDQDGEP